MAFKTVIVDRDGSIGTTAINAGLLCTGPIIPIAARLEREMSEVWK